MPAPLLAAASGPSHRKDPVFSRTAGRWIVMLLAWAVTTTALAAASAAGTAPTGYAVPIGGELNYLDDGTIGAALRARKQF